MKFSFNVIVGGTLVSRRRVDSDGLDLVVAAQLEPLCRRLSELAQNPDGGVAEVLLPSGRTWVSIASAGPIGSSVPGDLIFRVGLSYSAGISARQPCLYLGLLMATEGDLRILSTLQQESLTFRGENWWALPSENADDYPSQDFTEDLYDARGAVLTQICEPESDALYTHMDSVIDMVDYIAAYFVGRAEADWDEFIISKIQEAKEAAGTDWIDGESIASMLGKTAEVHHEGPGH